MHKFYFLNKFDTNLIDKQDKETIIIFRNYKDTITHNQLIKLKNYCNKKGKKVFLANNIKLAIKLNFDGAYIPSFNKSFCHLNYSLKKKFLIIGSAHNIKEIRTKELQKVSVIFLSSLFKKNHNYLGLYRFKIFSNFTRLHTVALGGISYKNIRLVRLTNSEGFAGISFFE